METFNNLFFCWILNISISFLIWSHGLFSYLDPSENSIFGFENWEISIVSLLFEHHDLLPYLSLLKNFKNINKNNSRIEKFSYLLPRFIDFPVFVASRWWAPCHRVRGWHGHGSKMHLLPHVVVPLYHLDHSSLGVYSWDRHIELILTYLHHQWRWWCWWWWWHGGFATGTGPLISRRGIVGTSWSNFAWCHCMLVWLPEKWAWALLHVEGSVVAMPVHDFLWHRWWFERWQITSIAYW